MPSPVPAHLVAFANHLADLAGDILRAKAGAPPVIEIKPDGTPVTDADRAVETAIRAEIIRAYPAHGIRGEEFPAHLPDAEHVWIIDPLDGTKEYTLGLPLWGFLLSLAHAGRFILGLADQPQLRHRWLGADGHGTTRDGAPVHVSARTALSECTISTMGYDTFCAHRHATLAALRTHARAAITADSFYVFGLLAEGKVDLIASDGFALHDHAALDAVVRNAGGTVTDWAGDALTPAHSGTILASATRELHAQALKLLNG